MKTMLRKVLVAAVLAGVSGGVLAERDGGLGSDFDTGVSNDDGSSKGDFDITLIKSAKARVWGLGDFTFDESLSPQDQDVCIYSNASASDGTYTLTAASDNAFTLVSAGAPSIAYTVTFDDNATQTTNGTPGNLDAGALASQPNPAANCGDDGAKNLNIAVALDSSITNLNRVQQGSYVDKVTVTVEPN